MQLHDELHAKLKKALLSFQDEYKIKIWIAALGGSCSIGTNNASSDFDIYVIYDSNDKLISRSLKYNSKDNDELHIVSCSVKEILTAIETYNKEEHIYPSYLNRTPEEMELNQKLTMYDREEYPRSLVYYTLMADTIWNFDIPYAQCFNKFKEGLVISAVLDFYYTKAHGNYDNFISEKENILVRKYITTIQEVLYCRWMCEKQTVPPMDVTALIHEAECDMEPELKQEIYRVYNANLHAAGSKFKVTIPRVNILNDFILRQLNDMKKHFSILENRQFIKEKEF